MQAALPFGQVLEAVDALPLEEQEELMQVVRQRIIEQRRRHVVGEVAEAEAEFEAGRCEARTPEELMREIRS